MSLKRCPFCKHQPEDDVESLRDSCHPVTREMTLWVMSCNESEGGCGASVYGHDRDTAITAWNTRAPIAEGGAYAESIDEIETLFHKCVSTLVPAGYANGYLEAIRHIKDRAAEKAQLPTPAAIESLSRQGGEYDRELIAKMLDELEPVVGLQHIRESVANQARLLRAAANRDAAGVHTGRASEAGDCVWTVDGDGTWETAYGEAWQFTCDGPEENNFRFCHGCGKPVAIAAAPADGEG